MSTTSLGVEHGAWYLWTVTLSGIAFWTAHVLVEVSLVPYSRHHHALVWWMHGFTVLLAVAAAVAALLSWRIARRARAMEGDDTPAGRSAFLGWFGLFSNATNMVLIIVEGVYIGVLWTHA
ncbi:MAG: hypothetical protein JWN62_1328 [Acidimicrobiales bacterium]|nr:hypothetical protein [Acidimicrobiales bacterium]